jgi:hypothetical protein
MPSPRNRWIGALAILCAAAPFGFGLMRAVSTGSDFRYLWVALASGAGAVIVVMTGRRTARESRTGTALLAGSFLMSTLLAVLMAMLLGTRLGPGLVVVASAFGFCSAAGSWVYARSYMR